MATPLQFLTEYMGNRVYIKRDDLLPFCFGGNKARKAALYFAEIDGGGYDAVVTYGSLSSNHCRVVANMAAARSLRCVIVSPSDSNTHAGINAALVQGFGAEYVFCPVSEVHDTIESTIKKLRDGGAKPYFIAGGGHGNLGTQAYVDCYNEIAGFEASEGIAFDKIFLASGTGTTQAGLVSGALLHGSNVEVVGISIARSAERGGSVVAESVAEYMKSVDAPCTAPQIIFTDEYTCGGYGRYNAAVADVVRSAMRDWGVPLSLTYTGKAFYGMKEYIKEHEIRGKNILFLHTGGAPLFFDDMAELGTGR